MVTLNKDIFVTVDGERKKLEGDELKEFLAQSAIDQAIEAERKVEADIKAKAKSALLEKLGITEDEAKLLFS